ELMRFLFGSLSEGDIQKYCRQKDLLFQKEMKNIGPVAGVEHLLQQLSRDAVPMAVASSGGRARVHQTLELLRLRNYFRALVTGDDVTAGKNDVEIFHNAARQLRVEPTDVLVFEDSVSGVRTATAAGMKCVGIASDTRRQALVHAGAVATVPDFTSVRCSMLS